MTKLMLAAGLAGVLAMTACTTTSNDLSGTQLRELLTGQTATFENGARATYSADGSYTYRGPWRGRNVVSTGRYFFRGNQVCINFDHGGRRCDRYARYDDGYYLINAHGAEFRARIGS